jgi:hypothetical protein
MRTAGFFKHPGYEDFIEPKGSPANRTAPRPVALKAINTAVDMHKPVGVSHGGKGGGFYPFPMFKPGGTYRTGSGRPGISTLKGSVRFSFLRGGPPGSRTKKKGIPEPKQKNAYNNK